MHRAAILKNSAVEQHGRQLQKAKVKQQQQRTLASGPTSPGGSRQRGPMQSSRETSYFTPLLFKKKDDQDQPSTSYTTPRPSRSPRSPSSAGMASGAGAQRRRSLTPTASTALQPAEPPSRSLYSDTSGVLQSCEARYQTTAVTQHVPRIPVYTANDYCLTLRRGTNRQQRELAACAA